MCTAFWRPRKSAEIIQNSRANFYELKFHKKNKNQQAKDLAFKLSRYLNIPKFQ